MGKETRVYAKRGACEMRADVYRPEGKPKAAVLLMHGGGWHVGGKDELAEFAIAPPPCGDLAIPGRASSSPSLRETMPLRSMPSVANDRA